MYTSYCRIFVAFMLALTLIAQADAATKEYIIFPVARINREQSEQLVEAIHKLVGQNRVYAVVGVMDHIPEFWGAVLSDQAFEQLTKHPFVRFITCKLKLVPIM